MKLGTFNAPCPICGKTRGRYIDHNRCSKLLQKQGVPKATYIPPVTIGNKAQAFLAKTGRPS